MSLTNDDIKKVAHLARLAINSTEMSKYADELPKILNFVAQMNSVVTDNVSPMAHPLNISQPLRPDVITATNQRELLQSIAPLVEAGLYLVPKVIE